jgi:TolB-like protein
VTTKVRFTATIEIDTQEWAEAYGMDPKGVRAIQDDVRAAVLNAIQQMSVAPVAVTPR